MFIDSTYSMLYVQNFKISIKIFNYMRRHLIVDKDQKKNYAFVNGRMQFELCILL